MIGLGIGLQVNVKLAFRITTNSFREKFASILEGLLKIVGLSWKCVRESAISYGSLTSKMVFM
jgi:hypothetical protein